MKQEMLPCPFCGEEKELYLGSGKAEDGNVFCAICGAEGPPDIDPIRAWNHRLEEN